MHKFVKRFAACGVILAAWASPAVADYPEKPIRIIVTAPAGGGTDIVARRVGQKLTEAWGQPVVVENRGGAGGSIAAQAVVRSEANGYTLLLAAAPNMTVNPQLYNWVKNVGIDPIKDFVPITSIASAPYLASVHPSVPAKNLPQLIALIKKSKERNESFGYASSNVGTPDHLSGVLFRLMAKVDNLVHIPYKGGGLALIAVRGGHVPMGFSTFPVVLPHVQSQAVRVLATTDSKRSKLLPNIPTVAETLPGYEILTWYGIWAPAGTPAAVVDKIYREVKRIVDLPEFAAFLQKDGFTLLGNTPSEFAEFVKKETAKYGEIVRAGNVRIN